MKSLKVITDPSAMELLGDETRRRIVYLLRARELTISQVAEELKLTPQAIYHHIKKLLKAEMVEVVREARVENFIESYYRASAEVFQFSWGAHGKEQVKAARQRLRESMLALRKIGISPRIDDKTLLEISQVQQRLGKIGEHKDLEKRIDKLDDVDFVGKQELASWAKMILMTDEQFQESIELQKELRKLVKSILSAKTIRNPKLHRMST